MSKKTFFNRLTPCFLAVSILFQMLIPINVVAASTLENPDVFDFSEAELVATSANHIFNSVAIIAELGLTGAGDTDVGTWTDGFFTVAGGRWRPGQGGGVFETNRNGDGMIQFTTDGSSTVVIVASSTGGANTSAITIWNEAGVAMTEMSGVTTVTGTNPQTTLTFENLPAGTYQIVSNDIQEGNAHNRGVRIFSVAVEPTAITNTFNSVAAIAELGLTGAGDTDVGIWTDGFFTVDGGRWRPGQGGGVFETNRNGDGMVQFTTDGSSTVVIVASSTGGANTSAITIWNADGDAMAEMNGVTTVIGTTPQTTLTFENLPAGTYRVVSNDAQEGGGHNRGVRIFSVAVTQAEGNPMDPADYPTDLEAVGGYDGLVRLTWSPVANATRHEFRYRPLGTDAWSLWAEASLRNSHTVTPLTNGTTYEFQVRGHDGTTASAESAIVTAMPTALPVLEITGVTAGMTHDFGTVPHNYTATNITPLEVVVRNTGTAPAENVAVTLTSGNTSFVLNGETTQGSLAPNAEMTFQVAPTLLLVAGLHAGVVTISANDLIDIDFNVNFNILSQNMNADWGAIAYHFNFANLPTDGTQTSAGAIGSIPTNPISARHDSIRIVAPHASRQDFELLIGIGTNANNGFRSNGTAPNNFIDPNGAGRLLGASHSLTAPIRVELDVLAVAPTLRSQLTLYFGEQSVTFPVTGTPTSPSTVVVEFASGEGVLRTSAFPWGANNVNDPVGRVGLQAVRIFEGEFTGSWIEADEQEIAFRNLPYGFADNHLETQYLEITNVGSEASPITAEVGSGFEITQAPSAILQAGESTVIGVRPIVGLDSGVHESSLVVSATADGNRLIIPVAVVVNDPLALPDDVVLFYSGNATSTTNQFPNDADEDVEWSHDFRRVSFTEDSHLVRFNGEVRDADVSLAMTFILNDVLWVPLAAAQAALPNTVWDITDGYLTVTSGSAIYNGTALVATEAVHGGNATFVALQEISEALNIGNIGWDERSGTLVVVTGATVYQGNVLYNNINNRPEAWYGSPNSITIATNFVYMQRANGGWPRGIGQINALPHQPDIGGMAPDVVQMISLGFNNEDSYFGRGITTNETRFLLRMYEATGIERFLESGLRGFDTIISTQDPIGGWPYQISGGSYHRALSISDNAISNLLWLMMDIETDNLFADTLGVARVSQAIHSLDLGMDWILNTQVRSAGFADGVERLTAWPMAVYQSGVENFTLVPGATPGITGEPAWQREFEPMSINGNESVDIIRFLMSIPNPSEEVIEAIHAAVYFFNYIRIDGYRLNHATGLDPLLGRNLVPEEGARPLWPRFIDLENFEPLFYDRTGPFPATVSPHQNVSTADFIAEHGAWQGYNSGFISANATTFNTGNANDVRAGTLRNLYQDANGNLTTERSGTFDLVASFHNLSFERRAGFNYINHFAETLPQEYAEWLVREVLTLVEGIEIDQADMTLSVGEDYNLTFTINPTDATNQAVIWTTSDATIVEVDEFGVITAIAPGTATIRVTADCGNYYDEIEVTVEAEVSTEPTTTPTEVPTDPTETPTEPTTVPESSEPTTAPETTEPTTTPTETPTDPTTTPTDPTEPTTVPEVTEPTTAPEATEPTTTPTETPTELTTAPTDSTEPTTVPEATEPTTGAEITEPTTDSETTGPIVENLTGYAVIDNMTPRVGDVLTGSLVDGNNTGELTFTWLVNGEVRKIEEVTGFSENGFIRFFQRLLGDSESLISTYLVTAEDLGYTITLEITSSVETGVIKSLETAPVAGELPGDTQPTTAPEATEPTTIPEVTEPTTVPETTEPTTAPEATEPTTVPEATEPPILVPTVPEATEPTTAPEASEPTTVPEATEPTTAPEATEPTTTPEATEPPILVPTVPEATEPTTVPEITQPTTSPAVTGPETTEPPTTPPTNGGNNNNGGANNRPSLPQTGAIVANTLLAGFAFIGAAATLSRFKKDKK